MRNTKPALLPPKLEKIHQRNGSRKAKLMGLACKTNSYKIPKDMSKINSFRFAESSSTTLKSGKKRKLASSMTENQKMKSPACSNSEFFKTDVVYKSHNI